MNQKEEQTKSKSGRRKEVIKIKVEIKNRKEVEKFIKPRADPLKSSTKLTNLQ